MKFSQFLFSVPGFMFCGLLALLGYMYYASWDVKRWDDRIDALCAANGGADVATRVYETAMAPETPEYFTETKPVSRLRIPWRIEGGSPERHPFVIETRVVEILNKKNPSVVKYTERIVRTSDDKILGERFAYQRSGGGIVSIDPDEIRNCPVTTERDRLDINVFVNHPRRNILSQK